MPLYIASGGIGIALENESLGSWTQTTTALSYDYQMVTHRQFRSAYPLELSAGFLQRKFDGTLARTPEGIFDDEGKIILGHSET